MAFVQRGRSGKRAVTGRFFLPLDKVKPMFSAGSFQLLQSRLHFLRRHISHIYNAAEIRRPREPPAAPLYMTISLHFLASPI